MLPHDRDAAQGRVGVAARSVRSLFLILSVVCLAWIPAAATAQVNLVANGDFESGNTGFDTTYTFMSTFAQNAAARYGIDVDPLNLHPGWASMGDHSSGTGNMMIVNGSPVTGPAGFVWLSPAAGSIAIAPNTDYFFEAFVANVFPVNGAILTFEVFNTATSSWDTLGTADLRSAPVAEWQAISFAWNSGTNTSTQLRLLNAQPAAGGNDFAVDDIHFGAGTSLAAIALAKTASGPDPLVVGAPITYTFDVTNTGDSTLANIAVTDPLPGLSPISCPGDTLTPSASMTCSATYTVTQADVDTGIVENTATVTGQSTNGPTVTANDSAVVPPVQTPGIALEKAGDGPDPLTLGATIAYTFTVSNIGNVTLTGVAVTDPLPGLSSIDCPATTLAPGASMGCTATYTVTQADVDAGVVENTATATGQPPSGPAASANDAAVVPPSQAAGISLEKSGSGPTPLTVGATATYSFLVTNTGNVTLTNVAVTDPLPGLSLINCPATTLNPGAQMTCTATYTVTQADVQAGVIQNTATVTASSPTGTVTDDSSARLPPVAPVPTMPLPALIALLILLSAAALWTLRRRTGRQSVG